MSSALRRFITDRRGRAVVAQRPNGPLLVWSILALAARTSAGSRRPLLFAARDATLAYWAGLELLDGDSPFRRSLGMATLLALGASLLGKSASKQRLKSEARLPALRAFPFQER